jgi:hypothetical protein
LEGRIDELGNDGFIEICSVECSLDICYTEN